jgi:hypothetical protein
MLKLAFAVLIPILCLISNVKHVRRKKQERVLLFWIIDSTLLLFILSLLLI